MRIRVITAALIMAAAMLALPVSSFAAASKPASGTYELDFTLPTAGKSGCAVCHADPNLVKASADVTSSLFVDPAMMSKGPHATTPCTGCHVDFAYKIPHNNVVKGEGWREVANSACKNCHKDQYAQLTKSAHTPVLRPGEVRKVSASVDVTRVPSCGDCHGSHNILSAKEMTTSVVFHNSGLKMCGECHKEPTADYNDYYHGAAYHRGAKDSPACWDCHTAHSQLPADAKGSTVSESILQETCANPTCHKGVGDGFMSYASIIHGKSQVEESNPVWVWVRDARGMVGSAVESVASLFGRN